MPDLNSVTTTDSVSFNVLTNLMEGFYRLDQDQKPIPAPAEGVEISSDGLTYTFTLRDGVQWSNGDPVTSQDFKYAWLKVLDPETAATYAYIISTFVKGADEYNTEEGEPGGCRDRDAGRQDADASSSSPSRRSSCSSRASGPTSRSSRSSSRSSATSTPRTGRACSTTARTR